MAYQGQIVHIDDDGNVLGSDTLGPQGIAGLSAAVALPDGSLAAGGLAQGRGFLVRMDASLRVTWQMPLSEVEEVIGMTALASGVAVAANQEKPTARLGIGRVLVLDADHHVRWQCRVPAERRGELAGLASLPDGDLIVVGHSTAADGAKTRILVTRLGGNGVPSWAQLLGPEDQEQRGRAIVALPDGSVVAVGDALDAMNRRRILVFRLSASGTTSWERSFGGAGSDVARGITRLNDGSLVVVGSTTRHGPGKTNALILHIDEHGDLLWERSFGSAAL
jgi:hypothetical protein